MKRIGITQRVVNVPGINERRDVLDQRWYDFSFLLGVLLIPIPNNLKNPVLYAIHLKLEGLIFSGGNNIGLKGKNIIEGKSLIENDIAYERDQTEAKLLEWASINEIPVVGVCRGMQFINTYFEGNIDEVDPSVHVAKNHQIELISKHHQTIYGSKTEVNSYHNFGIKTKSLAADLVGVGIFGGDEVEAFQHSKYRIYGIMWHPERYDATRGEDVKFFKTVFTNT